MKDLHKKRVRGFNILELLSVVRILNKCGKDMVRKYDLHHWDNSLIKTAAIVFKGLLKNSIYLVKDGGKTIATYQIRVVNKICYFEKLATLPTLAGKGIGTFCLLEIEKEAVDYRCLKVSMEVYEASQHAISFYEHKGYKTVDVAETYRYKVVKMEKQLEGDL